MKRKPKAPYRPEVKAILFCRDDELRIVLRQGQTSQCKMIRVSLASGKVKTSRE